MGTFAEQLAYFAEEVRAKADDIVREAVTEAGRRLIDRTPAPEKGNPYSTGKLISNWRYGLNSPDRFVSNETGIRQINHLDEMPKAAAGHIHYLTNATSYGYYVETGTSKMAAQPMVGLTALEWPEIVREAAYVVGARPGGYLRADR